MSGAIFYTTRYGSTRTYAQWIAEETGLPVFELGDEGADAAKFDFIVLGTPIYYYKPRGRRWIERNCAELCKRPLALFTVSGAPPGPKLSGWLAQSLPAALVDHMYHFALPGRQNRAELSLFHKIMLTIGSLLTADKEVATEEAKGFDYMDRSRIEPLVAHIRKIAASAPPPEAVGSPV